MTATFIAPRQSVAVISEEMLAVVQDPTQVGTFKHGEVCSGSSKESCMGTYELVWIPPS